MIEVKLFSKLISLPIIESSTFLADLKFFSNALNSSFFNFPLTGYECPFEISSEIIED